MDTVKLGIEIDASPVDRATAAFEKLAAAVDQASEALRNLNGLSHGGIEVQAVGEAVLINVKPASGGEPA